MTVERFLEIVNNKEYERLEYVQYTNSSLFYNYYCIKIYTKHGAYIRLRHNYPTGRFSKKKFTDCFDIHFFIPEEDRSVAGYRATENDSMYKTLEEIFNQLKAEVKDQQAKKYF